MDSVISAVAMLVSLPTSPAIITEPQDQNVLPSERDLQRDGRWFGAADVSRYFNTNTGAQRECRPF
jgi:hypothetical protein